MTPTDNYKKKLIDLIDGESIAQDTLDFLNASSETGNEKEGCDFFIDLLKREGLNIKIDEFIENRPNIYSLFSGNDPENGKTLMFNGHIDTIPIGNSDPPKIQDGWIIGRGSEDMKGGLISTVHAFSALKKSGISLCGNLWLTAVIGHETPIGRKEGPKRLIELLNSKEITTDAIVITEGPEAIWTASMGFMNFTISISTDKGSIHTIKTKYLENPAYWAGKILVNLQQLELQFETLKPHPLCGRNQLNIGKVNGGDYFNRLPSVMKINGTMRWTPENSMKQVYSELQDICSYTAKESGLNIDLAVEESATRKPFETSLKNPIIKSLEKAGNTVNGQPPAIIGMALVTDANLYYNDAQIATVGYGPQYETSHSDHERVSVNNLKKCAKIYALTAIEYCGVI